ncbi:MAG: hypothetical protein FWD68_12575 [Alphaproteobacteria bacterium]|nr:hypothetical protein [Alphaproteobacteria bacterium]
MADHCSSSSSRVVDFATWRRDRDRLGAGAMRRCRHCGGVLGHDENEDDCSSAFNLAPSGPRPRLAGGRRRQRR